MSRSLMVGLLAAGCMTAAAGGSYLAVRQSTVEPVTPLVATTPAHAPLLATAPAPAAAASATPAVAVHETETIIETPAAAAPTPELEAPAPPRPAPRTAEPRRRTAPVPSRESRRSANKEERSPATLERPAPLAVEPDAAAPPAIEEASAIAERPAPGDEPSFPRAADPIIEEVVIPASAVIGLEIENSVSTERAQVEDRVDARVTRDVFADGRLALPAGSRVMGAVTLVERGGKVKERARLGVRFHTVVLANGRQVPLRTETIFREGESPAGDSSRKIGGAAIGGAVLGAIFGGGKGAIAGATAGAAGGTAAVMSGGRNAAVLASGSVLTVKLAAPVLLDLER